jgi:hypothetical protein
MRRWVMKPDGDPTWSDIDWARAATLEARWKMAKVSEDERRILIPCAVWISKFPGMRLSSEIMERLELLSI